MPAHRTPRNDPCMAAPSPIAKKLCRLEQTVGREEECPEAACPFWQPGGAVLEGRCALETLDLAGRPELATTLLDIRKQLEAPRAAEEDEEARHLFYEL